MVAAAEPETWVVQGTTYQSVRVGETTPASVTIFHSGGITQIPLEKLPAGLQERFGFDPDSARDWQAARDSEEAARPKYTPPPPPRPEPHASSAAQEQKVPPGYTRVEIRDEVDLRPTYNELGLFFKDQGARPSCAVYAMVSALELEFARATGEPTRLSEGFLVWAVGKTRPGTPVDDGYHFDDIFAALRKYGVSRLDLVSNTSSTVMMDVIRKPAEEPGPEAVADGATRRGLDAARLPIRKPDTILHIVNALNNGKPVVIGVSWPAHRTLRHNHLVSQQAPLDGPGHAVTLVGYRCETGRSQDVVFIFRNSYGMDWGLAGCGFMTADYLQANLLDAIYFIAPKTDAATQG